MAFYPLAQFDVSKVNTPQNKLIYCLCAAWCNTCTEYQPKFIQLAERHPESHFIWVDIEEHDPIVGDLDVENFPTLLIQDATQTYFYGTQLPHIEHLERMITRDMLPLKDQSSVPLLTERLSD